MNKQSLQNCEKALKKLTDFLEEAKKNPTQLAQAGVIQAFEFTFEVFWKTFKKLGQADGVAIGGPKGAFSYAFQVDLIENEQIWLNLLDDRNMTTHVYHEELAQQIFERIKNDYMEAFRAALLSLQEAAD
jgi:nucleotidyltransferase substrate binding protein (TIGR01987 family)